MVRLLPYYSRSAYYSDTDAFVRTLLKNRAHILEAKLNRTVKRTIENARTTTTERKRRAKLK